MLNLINDLGMQFISRLRDDAVLFYLNGEPKAGKAKSEHFSMANFKTVCHNKLLIDRFIYLFTTNLRSLKNQSKIKIPYEYGLIAA